MSAILGGLVVWFSGFLVGIGVFKLWIEFHYFRPLMREIARELQREDTERASLNLARADSLARLL